MQKNFPQVKNQLDWQIKTPEPVSEFIELDNYTTSDFIGYQLQHLNLGDTSFLTYPDSNLSLAAHESQFIK
jgi:hypothetical protein